MCSFICYLSTFFWVNEWVRNMLAGKNRQVNSKCIIEMTALVQHASKVTGGNSKGTSAFACCGSMRYRAVPRAVPTEMKKCRIFTRITKKQDE